MRCVYVKRYLSYLPVPLSTFCVCYYSIMEEGQISCNCTGRQSVELWIRCGVLIILIVIVSCIFWYLLSDRASVDFCEVLRGGIVCDLLIVVLCVAFGIANSEIDKMACFRNQLSLLFIFVVMSTVVFSAISGRSLAYFVGDSRDGLVSLYAPLILSLVVILGLVGQLWLAGIESVAVQKDVILAAPLVVIGIFLPKLFDSYEVLRATCFSLKCGLEKRDQIVIFDLIISISVALAFQYIFVKLWELARSKNKNSVKAKSRPGSKWCSAARPGAIGRRRGRRQRVNPRASLLPKRCYTRSGRFNRF